MKTYWIYRLAALGLALLFWSACGKVADVSLGSEQQVSAPVQLSISGSVDQPEWVDMEGEGLRAFTLKPNAQEYPKIHLPEVEQKGFESFVSCVWLFPKSVKNRDPHKQALRIYVEDNQGDVGRRDSHASPNTSNTSIIKGSSGKGISRIVKKDGKYRVLVGFHVPKEVKQGSLYNSMLETFRAGEEYNIFVALNPLFRKDSETGASIHRIHYPVPHAVDPGGLKEPPPLPPLRVVSSQDLYVVGQSTTDAAHLTKNQDNAVPTHAFVLPFFSRFGEKLNLEEVNGKLSHGSALSVRFKMVGVLLALKFENKIGRPIKLKKLYTKSSHLAYSGFYELWPLVPNERYPDFQNSTFGNTIRVPFFMRTVVKGTSDALRNATYKFDIQDNNGNALPSIAPRAASNGRAYLWGAIDLDKTNTGSKSTRCQVVYEYENQPGVQYISKVVDLSQKKSGGKVTFEEGKAYLITVPIEQKGRLTK
ncbi:MAG: hypothetical protein Q4A64_04615 [Porphyromonadaceae bacterium]|nr:hypothetical protein [Porphyromonadaceae bacterium]